MRNKFKTTHGWLTDYALSCGYLEVKTNADQSVSVRIKKESSGCYSVRAYDYFKHERLCWDYYEKLGDARKAFTTACKKYVNG